MERADNFPEDLTGHFWATLDYDGALDRYRYSVLDYQGNVMVSGVATSAIQASRIVRAWDTVICSDFEGQRRPKLDVNHLLSPASERRTTPQDRAPGSVSLEEG